MAIKRVRIISNEKVDANGQMAARIASWLALRGVEVCTEDSQACLVVTLGGDGTMLRAAASCAAHGTPMLGINLGNMGFLTAAEPSGWENALTQVLAGNAIREERMMLQVQLEQTQTSPPATITALNDIVVGNSGRLMALTVRVNGQTAFNMRADGIIVCTPTGSTGYNLSAGGPILLPQAQMLGITPICAHTLSARPWVVGATDVVQICTTQPASVSVDGAPSGDTRTGDVICISRAPRPAIVLKIEDTDFHTVLKRKKLL
jgi:NAD+ kinase